MHDLGTLRTLNDEKLRAAPPAIRAIEEIAETRMRAARWRDLDAKPAMERRAAHNGRKP